tara:strand:+ start:5816 stop:6481 length:666 start_codon:yes stop_codon:yes gene_type:complete
MVIYSSSWKNIFSLYKIVFRGNYISIIKKIIKVLLAKKNIVKTNNSFVSYSHRRQQEDRFYGLIFNDPLQERFFKIEFNEFTNKIKNIDSNFKAIEQCSQILVPISFKHGLLTRNEFESLGYGLIKKIYHGDISRDNILKNNSKIILIDNEYEREYSLTFQNLDYLINCFQKSKLSKLSDLNTWFVYLNMYCETTYSDVLNAFKERLQNGCDIAKKINELK